MNLSSIAAEKLSVTAVIYAYICFFNLIDEIASENDMADIEDGKIMFALGLTSSNSMPYAAPWKYPPFLLKNIENEKEKLLYTGMVRQIIERERIHRALMRKFEEYYVSHERDLLEMDITTVICEKMMDIDMFHIHMEELDQTTAKRLRKEMTLGIQRNAEKLKSVREEGDISLTQEEVDVMLDFLSMARRIYNHLRESAGDDFGNVWENIYTKSSYRLGSTIYSRLIYATNVVFKRLDDTLRELVEKKETGNGAGDARRYRFAATYEDGYENLRRCRNGAVLLRFRAYGSKRDVLDIGYAHE
jgi:hypothetical protein